MNRSVLSVMVGAATLVAGFGAAASYYVIVSVTGGQTYGAAIPAAWGQARRQRYGTSEQAHHLVGVADRLHQGGVVGQAQVPAEPHHGRGGRLAHHLHSARVGAMSMIPTRVSMRLAAGSRKSVRISGTRMTCS